MSIAPHIRAGLVLPVVCAPMFTVSGPELVLEACLSGVIGGLPRHNARSFEEFERWLAMVRNGIDRRRETNPAARTGSIAVNMASNMTPEEFDENLAACARYGVEIIINATGNPAELTKRAHDRGFLVYADAISIRFAEKAMSVNVDGITAIGAGGGGHSGVINHLSLVAAIRARFDKTVLMAGAISTGAAIRAAEILGADLAYLGTRFIATQEARASEGYKDALVRSHATDLIFTARLGGAPANWLKTSLIDAGVDLGGEGTWAGDAKPWRDIWSAGQGVDQIDEVLAVHELVTRLRHEYDEACGIPVFLANDLADRALSTRPP